VGLNPLAGPSGTGEPSPGAGTAAPDIPAGMALIKTDGAIPGRRVFINGRTVGQTPDAIVVRCGTLTLKIGSSGRSHTVEVPCGQEFRAGDL